jgi:ribosome-associated translation inhibitor RaiA
MEIEINAAEGVQRSEALDAHVRERLGHVSQRFGDRLTRLRVYMKDVNARKGGIDKACTMEARPAGMDPVAVEAQDEDVYKSVRDAAGKLEKALGHRFGRAEARD